MKLDFKLRAVQLLINVAKVGLLIHKVRKRSLEVQKKLMHL
jgi:hypothetical protein